MKITRRQALATLAVGAAGTGLYGLLGSRDLHVDRKTLPLPRWDADGFRVVQISDIHVNDGAQTATAQRAVELAAREKPDLLVLTGDFVNYSADECVSNIPKALAGLDALDCPCLAILGNHDYSCGDVDKVIAHIGKTPLKLLRNQIFEYQGLTIAGFDDGLQRRQDVSILDAKKNSRSTLALLHEPDYVTLMPAHVSLQLSGHSHGGEVCLPGGVPVHLPKGAKRYPSGFYDRKAVPLFVSRGTATLGPGRVYCPAEINVLTLRSS